MSLFDCGCALISARYCMGMTTTQRLTDLLNQASSCIARDNAAGAESALQQAEQILAAHPRVKHAEKWDEILGLRAAELIVLPSYRVDAVAC